METTRNIQIQDILVSGIHMVQFLSGQPTHIFIWIPFLWFNGLSKKIRKLQIRQPPCFLPFENRTVYRPSNFLPFKNLTTSYNSKPD